MQHSTGILYRFPEIMTSCITVHRYATIASSRMERPWVPAIRRLMAAKGWNQRVLSDKSGVRPNTLSDLLGGADSRIETLGALAAALEVPLWALFCSDHEHALFTERAKQDSAQQHAEQRDAAVAARILEGLKPLVLAAVKGEAEPTAAPQPQPVPVQAKRRKVGR